MNSSTKHIACILASGASVRFGQANKLLSAFKGRPLITHSIENVHAAGFDRVFCIVPERDTQLQKVCIAGGAELLLNTEPQRGQSQSLVLAAKQALKLKVSSMLIALGDMPLVSPQHFINLRSSMAEDDLVISSDGELYYGSPVLFGTSFFQQLLDLRGDQGAKALIRSLSNSTSVCVSSKQLLDVDTRQELT